MSATTEDREPVRRALGLGGRALIAVTAVLGFALISQVRLGPGPDEPGTTTRPGGAAASGDVTATPAPTPKPVYAAVFDGDGTGETDVTAQLERFLESHAGEHVALEPGATYLVRELEFTVRDLTLDFRGARIITDKPGSLAIFHLIDGERVVLNDPTVHGTGFTWSGGDDNPEQWEAGIEINGGSEVTINRPVTRDTRGDGIYIGFEEGTNQPARDVVIVEPDIQRASRNGISPVAGEVTIRGGSIQDVGLHGIDFEPNNDVGALQHRWRGGRSRSPPGRGVGCRGPDGLCHRGRRLLGRGQAVAGAPERDRGPSRHAHPRHGRPDDPRQRV